MSNIGKRVFKFDVHPICGERMFREYEIVGETRTLWRIQPRNIPNKKAETLTRDLAKCDVCDTSSQRLTFFYWSRRQAIEVLLSSNWKWIAKARTDIEDYQQEIKELQALLERYV